MDTISNMIIQLKNAGTAGHNEAVIPFSKTKLAIVEVLKKEGFIRDFSVEDRGGKKNLKIDLILANRIPKINGVRRISKPSKRVYKKASEIRPIKNGYGFLVLSTSRGVMTGGEARRLKLGGEALFTIW